MALLRRAEIVNDEGVHQYNQWFWWCPGCDMAHSFADGEKGWTFNGNLEKPTVQPSIMTWPVGRGGVHDAAHPGCHVFITDGMIHYLGDCFHTLKGQTVPMVALPDWLANERNDGDGA